MVQTMDVRSKTITTRSNVAAEPTTSKRRRVTLLSSNSKRSRNENVVNGVAFEPGVTRDDEFDVRTYKGGKSKGRVKVLVIGEPSESTNHAGHIVPVGYQFVCVVGMNVICAHTYSN